MFEFLKDEDPTVRDVVRKVASRIFRAAALGQKTLLDADAITEVETAVRARIRREGQRNAD